MKKLKYEEIFQQRLSIEESKNTKRHPVKLILHNIRSLYNVGSIFRTCDSALISELILCGFTPFPPRKEIEKTALGAVDTVPWKYYKKIEDSINDIKKDGWKIAALEICDKSIPFNTLKPENFPLCIIAGNEISGVDDYILDMCDFALHIPMFGVKHSLNVSVAVGIALYSAVEAATTISDK